ncbi:MAG TPA: AbrB family transcriptional regulator [Paracoccaceae bacterium]|nr:AbrB family transcriptional regulator [Paracoccaceae bacterium]
MLRLLGADYHPVALVATLVLGSAGGAMAAFIGTPLPWLFGSVLAVGAVSIAGLKVRRAPLCFPPEVRGMFVPVIGVSIGGAFTPEMLSEAAVWGPSLLALFLYVPMVHVAGYAWCRHVGGLAPATAWFGAMPGGFVEAIVMGEAFGAQIAVLAAMQFLRLIMCILLIPLGFSLIEGVAVGSAAGVSLPGAGQPLSAADALVLVACGVSGYFAGRWMRLPAGVIAGPLLVSGVAHLAGLVDGHPPAWAVQVTQLVIGVSLGVRFAGVPRRDLVRALRLSATLVAGTLALAALMGFALGHLVGESVEAVILAFAPGGLVEMSLVALSLGVSAIYVTVHHVLRILLAVTFGRLAWGYLSRRRGG